MKKMQKKELQRFTVAKRLNIFVGRAFPNEFGLVYFFILPPLLTTKFRDALLKSIFIIMRKNNLSRRRF